MKVRDRVYGGLGEGGLELWSDSDFLNIYFMYNKHLSHN